MTAPALSPVAPAADLLGTAANGACTGLTLRDSISSGREEAQAAANGVLLAVLDLPDITALWGWDAMATPDLRAGAAQVAERRIRRIRIAAGGAA